MLRNHSDSLLGLWVIECFIQELPAPQCARHCGAFWDARMSGTKLLTAHIPSKSPPPFPLFSTPLPQSNYFIHKDGEVKKMGGERDRISSGIVCRVWSCTACLLQLLQHTLSAVLTQLCIVEVPWPRNVRHTFLYVSHPGFKKPLQRGLS